MSTIKLIEDSKVITTRIKALSKKDKSLHTEKVLLACSCLAHAEKHNDVTLLTRLADAVWLKAERQALIKWAEHFGRVKYEKKLVIVDGVEAGEAWGFVSTAKGKNWTPRELSQEAIDKPYTDGIKADPTAWDEKKVMASIIKLLVSKEKQARAHGSIKMADKIAAMLDLKTATEEKVGEAA